MDIVIVIGSTRPGRQVEGAAGRMHQHTAHRLRATYGLPDTADHAPPLTDKAPPTSAAMHWPRHTREALDGANLTEMTAALETCATTVQAVRRLVADAPGASLPS